MNYFKIFAFYVSKFLGLFFIANILTKNDLRILGYHGAAIKDEHLFRPMLFMTDKTFERRMHFLHKKGYTVLELNEAVNRLIDGNLPPKCTVITIDDGWYGTYLHMAPILLKYNFCATMYTSTYYLENQKQVFDVTLGYLLWKTNLRNLDMREISPQLQGCFDLVCNQQHKAAYKYLLNHSNSLKDANQRQALLKKICSCLDVDYKKIEENRMFSYINTSEAIELLSYDVDIQLHTHSHRFPEDDIEKAKAEIELNRYILRGVTSCDLVHFCYPSGHFKKHQIQWLPELKIKTATTTIRGLNKKSHNLLELRRFLDSEDLSMIEFEAEMSGFKDLARAIVTR